MHNFFHQPNHQGAAAASAHSDFSTASRPCVVVGTARPPSGQAAEECAPHTDFAAIAHLLGAPILLPTIRATLTQRLLTRIERLVKLDVQEVALIARQSPLPAAVLSMSERTAIPLALLLLALRRQTAHVLIGHKLSTGRKTGLLKALFAGGAFSDVICLARSQGDYARSVLGMDAERVHVIPYQVDHNFFCANRAAQAAAAKPLSLPAIECDYILAVGREQRDYATLARALYGLPYKLIILDSSPWASQQTRIHEQIAPNITIVRDLTFTQLRALYAGARLVALPLFDVDYAAGVSTLLEAMAMSKPIVVSRSRGIVDHVVGGETALLVPPGKVEPLRAAIERIVDEPTLARRLGANARRTVEETMSLERYAERVAQIVCHAEQRQLAQRNARQQQRAGAQ